MRVNPPSPVHTRPYGPGRHAVIIDVGQPITAHEADEIRRRIRAAVPTIDVLLIAPPTTVAYPPTNPPEATP